jgi:hypothetical protein
MYSNGASAFKILRLGTKRILAANDPSNLAGYSVLPEDIRSKLTLYNHILADFTVCPFTPDKPGVMRMVCVDSATKVTVRPGGLDSPVTPERRR